MTIIMSKSRTIGMTKKIGLAIQWFVFSSALILTVAFQGHLLLRKLGWVLLAGLSLMKIDFAILAAAFFSAFFISSGFIPDLFFTVKHFHVMMALIGFAILVSRRLFSTVWTGAKQNGNQIYNLIFWLGILFISNLSAVSGALDLHALKTSANLLSLLACSALLTSLIREAPMIGNTLLFLGFGVLIRIILSSLASLGGYQSQFFEPIAYNNHLSFLITSSFFLLLPIFFSSTQLSKKVSILVMLIVLFAALVFTRSRTGWFTFVICFSLYAISFFKYCTRHNETQLARAGKRFYVTISFVFVSIFVMALLINVDVWLRVDYLKFFVDWEYLKFMVRDVQNFGFLGIGRLNQFVVTWEIFKHHWLTGVGFTHAVTDLHCLYLTFLAGSGIAGFLMFILFCCRWFRRLLQFLAIKDESNLLRIGVMYSLLVWLLSSLMESFFLQFHIWLIIAMGMILAKPIGRTTESSI